jgi:hypothetical protein
MTSVNAMRLNFHSGLCICDEARYWNPEWMIFHTPEKIRSVVCEELTREQGIVLFMGQTGTSSIGDEFIDSVEKEITALYQAEKKKQGKAPERFRTVEDLARVAFEVITRIKRRHVDDMLLGRYDFDAFDLMRGFYEREGVRKDISDEDIAAKALKYITFEGNPDDVKGIFGNSQILAGYDPETGFRIFYMTERMPICEEVREIFLAQGSGRDTCDLVFTHFANTRTVRERRGEVDRLDGLIAMLQGLNNAFRLTAGVEGYPKIIYFDAKNTANRLLEISDGRSKLAGEMVSAAMEGFVPWKDARKLVDRVIFQGEPVAAVNADFFGTAPDARALALFLRGYAVSSPLGAW